MNAHFQARARRRPVAVAVSIAGLALLSAGCARSATLTAGPSGAAASTSPAPSGPPATGAAVSSAPAATTAPAGTGAAPATTPASAPVDARIEVYGNCKTPAVEPAELVLACADYGTLLDGLHWASWTATRATAVGTLVYNDCMPNCADGHQHDIPGTRVTLTVPVTRGAQALWSRVQESPQPPGYATGPDHGGPQPLPLGPV